MNNKDKILKYISQGLSNKDISNELNVSIRTVERYRKQFREATTTSDKITTSDRRKKKRLLRL